MRDLSKDEPVPGLQTILQAQPDILLLTDVDFDAGLAALRALQDRLNAGGLDLPNAFAARPNTGMSTGEDLDGDGRLGGPRDAQGYGWFSGQGGQAILSRWPMRLVEDHSALLWKEAEDSLMRPEDPAQDIQRLSTSAHWRVEVMFPEGPIDLLTLSATPPVFDGPEDRNGRRNRDEVLFWKHKLNEPSLKQGNPVVLLGNFNLDPQRGEGLRAAMADVLAHPRLQDPLPEVPTVAWERVGAMRVSYVLPDRAFSVVDAGVSPPETDAGPHRLVWVDLDLSR